MGNLGWTEILIILGIALIVFGPRKLPQLGKSLGESLAQFRRASEDFKRTWEQEVDEEKYKIESRSPNYLENPYGTQSIESSTESESATSSEENKAVQASGVEPAVAETK
jgi:TatA/E family protein of Tat protein translocase